MDTNRSKEEGTNHQNSPNMASSCCRSLPIIVILVWFLLVPLLVHIGQATASAPVNNTIFRPHKELLKMKRMKAHLRKLNKPSLRTIQSPEGDIIDCVAAHLQPAFDHPQLKGQKPMEPPEMPKGLDDNKGSNISEMVQSWAVSGESCPEGTVPIRRTSEDDLLRASSIGRFGRKSVVARTKSDSTGGGHEHAVGYVMGNDFYGAKASINVWAPKVSSQSEFSLSQIWIISGSFDNDLNTIEAGWQVSPQLYGDSSPRFFTYWTTDAYQATGCYNMLCSGFIQTSNRIAIGAAISPLSSYNGGQFDIGLLIWKDPKHGNWWLQLGPGQLVGYWPAFLFNHLSNRATMVQFGGEIVDSRPSGFHTSTQMGSGHIAQEGFGKASYFRNLQVVDWDNSLIPPNGLRLLADHPNCYDVKGGSNSVWGEYFYYGGPGRSTRCP